MGTTRVWILFRFHICVVGILFARTGDGSKSPRPGVSDQDPSLQSSGSKINGARAVTAFAAGDGQNSGPTRMAPSPGPSSRSLDSISIVETQGCELFNSSQYSQCLTQGCTCSPGASQNSSQLPIASSASTQFACCQSDTAGVTTCYPPLANGTCSSTDRRPFFPGCCPNTNAFVNQRACEMASLLAIDRILVFPNGTVNPDPGGIFPICSSQSSRASPACCVGTTRTSLLSCAMQTIIRSSTSSNGTFSCPQPYYHECCMLPSSRGASAPAG